MTDTPETMTRAEFTRYMGWKSQGYTHKVEKQGRLVMTEDNKFVRVAESVERLAATKDPARDDVQARNAAQRDGEPAEIEQQPELPLAAEAVPDPRSIDPTDSYQEWRRRGERADTIRKEAETEERIGNLCERADVRSAASEAGAFIGGLIESLPAQWSAELAAMNDEAVVQAYLSERFDQLRADITDALQRAAG